MIWKHQNILKKGEGNGEISSPVPTPNHENRDTRIKRSNARNYQENVWKISGEGMGRNPDNEIF
jgi:hypothetical protein